MRITIEKLRGWVLVLGVALVMAIVGSLAYARYRLRGIPRDLPARLGLEIEQSTNDFTISKSHDGHTLFTLHASKAVQYKGGGRAVLHGVSIVMYGKDGQRTDTITGSQFDYDPSTRIARADGAVEIELVAPLPQVGTQGKANTAQAPIQVKTSGLVFDQEKQVATTEQALTFAQGSVSGSARGATYDSAKGTLLLAHDVLLHGLASGEPIAVHAAGATFDRATRQLYLIQQETDYQQKHCSSDQAVVYFRSPEEAEQGAVDHITAEGHVHLVTDDGGDLRSFSGTAQLGPQGALEQVRLNGGLLFVRHNAAGSLHVDSNSGLFTFSPSAVNRSEPRHLKLNGAVSVVDQQLTLAGNPHGSETREARAEHMDFDLAPGPDGKAQAQNVLAVGGPAENGSAVVTVHTIRENAPQRMTRLKGNQIYATLANGRDLSTLRATDSTSLEQSTPGGLDQISSGDQLLVIFAGKDARDKTDDPGSHVLSADQQGNVAFAETQPGATPDSPPVKTSATAGHVHYDGVSGQIALTGGTPRITQYGSDKDASSLTAAAITFNRTTGAGTATGGVKATYAAQARPGKGGDAQAVHVVADHAALDHGKDETAFFGAGAADARLWQGANSILAPSITLARARQLLTATGPADGVKATFVEDRSGTKGNDLVRLTGGKLVYSGGERKATLSGGAVAHDAQATVRAATMEIYLRPSNASSASAGNSGFGGQVERLVAEEHVRFTQGDRTGSGERLVYTADDGRFLLTGSGASPPRVADPGHGAVTGATLVFNDRDDSVVVSQGTSPTVTDTRTTDNRAHK